MREILFRGKRTDNGEWVEGNLFYDVDLEQAQIFYFEYSYSEGGLERAECAEIVAPETVGQYTGLTDKYGKKIFEGDIIKSDNGRVSAISIVLYGKFEPKHFYDLMERYVRPRPTEKLYGLFAKSTKGEEMLLSECSHLIEVIGNIHDNPELMKGAGR